MTGGKVLLLETLGADYGSYFLARGFCDLLGPGNVRSWPYKHSHNGGNDHYPERCHNPPGRPLVLHVTPRTGTRTMPGQRPGTPRLGYVAPFPSSELWAHRALWRGWKPEALPGAAIANSGPVHFFAPLGIPEASDDEIFQMVREGAFSLAVVNGARWHGTAALHELRHTIPSLPPVALADHEDYPQRRSDFTDAISPAVYCKRTMLEGGHPMTFRMGLRPNVRVAPLPFSSIWDVPWVPWAEREFDVCCLVGNTHVSRKRMLEATKATVERLGARGRFSLGHLPYPEFLQVLSRSKIVVDQQGFGSDTVRFWEGISSGAAVLSDHHLVHPAPALQPGTHFLQYPNDTSPASDKQDFRRFAELLAGAIQDDAGTERIARAGYDAVRAHHRAVHRAQLVIAETRAAGHALGGLP